MDKNKLLGFILMGLLPSMLLFFMTGGFEDSNAGQFMFSMIPIVLSIPMIML